MINQILPFYDSIEKWEKARYNSNPVRYVPRHALPSFLLKKAHSSVNSITSVNLIDCNGATTDITNYFIGSQLVINSWSNYGGGYSPTFTAVGGALSVVDSIGGGTAISNTFSVTSGLSYRVCIYLNLISGEAPTLYIGDPSAKSNQVVLSNGLNTITLTATGTGTFSLVLNNSNATHFASGVPDLRLISIATYYNYTSVDYYQHNETTLADILPLGKYYLKISDGSSLYYSEWFEVVNIYSNICNSFSNSGLYPMDTLTTSGNSIVDAINNVGEGRAYTTSFAVSLGEVIKVKFDLRNIGGVLPSCSGYETGTGTDVVTGDGACVAGLNEFSLTATKSTNISIGLHLAAPGEFSTGEVKVYRSWSSEYCKLTFTNSLDLGDILYQHSFTQVVYLCCKLLHLEPKQILIVDERYGVQIVESVITLPQYEIVDMVTPLLAKVLKHLPGHSTISVIDDLGITYSPDNIELTTEQIDYSAFKISLKFTDNEIINTLNQSNIT